MKTRSQLDSESVRRRGSVRFLVALIAASAVIVSPALIGSSAAEAAGSASVSITPASTTVPSGTAVTYTLSVTCSVTGGCSGTTVTFPSTTITGDGATTDFGSWFGASSCPAVTKSVSAGTVTYTYGNIPTGSSQCTFTVTPPDFTTANGATATLTPTINGTDFTSSTGSSATLTATASATGTNISKVAPGSVAAGAALGYAVFVNCPGSGAIATSSVTITDPLPAGFTYTSSGTPAGTVVVYNPVTNTVTLTGTGNLCGIELTIFGTATTNGVADTVGSVITNTASATLNFVDGSTLTRTASASTRVVSLIPTPFLTKSTAMRTWGFGNLGQYRFNGTAYPYTYPGDWAGSGTEVYYDLVSYTNSTDAGVDFAVQDPLPCLTNLSGGVYTSNAPGTVCAAPAYIPTLITVSGFTPTAADAITVVHTDGSTASIPYTPGTGWVVPTAPAVSEIDYPPFAEEGSNSSTQIHFQVQGYASSSVPPQSLLTNTATSNAYLVGSSIPLAPQETAQGNLLVANPNEPSGTIMETHYTAGASSTTCTANVGQSPNDQIEIASAPSQAIYVSYLAPVGATITFGETATFTATAVNGQGGGPYTTAPIPATVTSNYNGTGRTLLQWVIPAGFITHAGYYNLAGMDVGLDLGKGCAGTYNNDITQGYGAPITDCLAGSAVAPPYNPPADTDLRSNGSPIAGNYCGFSLPFTLTPINPAYSLDKSVQGNLDPAPVSAGGIGNVSPTGGSATYQLDFTNTGSTNLVNPVMYDILPAVGDTNNTDLSQRGSQFGVSLTGVGSLPAGMTVEYSTATNPCRPEILPTDPGCVNDWSTTPPASLSAVTALKFAYTGTVYVSGGAGPVSLTVSYTVSTPPASAGAVAWNTVGSTVQPGAGQPLMAPAESSRTGLRVEAPLTLVKSADASSISAAGQLVTYSFLVTNPTLVTMTNIAVAEGAFTGTGPVPVVQCPASTLAAGASETCTAVYAATQADLDQGGVSNSATASGTDPSGALFTTPLSTVTVPTSASPALLLVKAATPTSIDTVGQQVMFSFLVRNTGNVTMSGIAIAEGSFSGTGALPAPTCPQPSVAPGATETCTTSYTVTQADLDAGQVTNTATATGTPPGSTTPVPSAPSTVVVPVTQEPSLTLVKSASTTAPGSLVAGDTVTFSYVVTNTGNVILSGIAIVEGTFTGTGTLPAPTCPAGAASLEPGAQIVCTTTYTLTQADVDAGNLSNTATAEGTPPDSATPVPSNPSTANLPEPAAPGIVMAKTASVAGAGVAGDVVTYSFAVTDTGNTTLDTVGVNDTGFTGTGPLGAITCPATTLVPGQTTTCTARYTLTQADVDAGTVTNTAIANGTPPGSATPVSSLASTASITTDRTAALTVTKTANPASVARAGDLVGYSFVVTNTGTVTVTDPSIIEGAFSGAGLLTAVICPAGALAPTMSVTCTASYTVTQADVDAGAVTNTATATATPPAGVTPPVSAPSTATVTATPAPALSLLKSATPTSVDVVGQQLTFSFQVTNTGNVTMSGVSIAEGAFSGTGTLPAPSCPQPSLAPGSSETCTASYLVTQADLDAGQVVNTATATGTPPGSTTPVPSAPSTATVPATQSPGLTVVKSASSDVGSGDFAVGQHLTYSFVVTNTGNVTLSGIAIAEGAFSGTGTLPAPTCPAAAAALAPGAQVVCTTSYTLTQADVDAGSVTNTATADGTPPGTTALIPSTASTVTLPEPPHPAITLVKTADVHTITGAGQTIHYTFTLTNTGNVTLTQPAIHEGAFSGHGTLAAPTCPATPAGLLPGQTITCATSYTVTAADLTGTPIDNTATATAATPEGTPTSSSPSTAIVEESLPAPVPIITSTGPIPAILASTGSFVDWALGLLVAGILTATGVLLTIRRRRHS